MSTQPRSGLTVELLAFLEKAREAVEASARTAELAKEAGKQDLVDALESFGTVVTDQLTELREALESIRAEGLGTRDVVEEASVESFPASDAPAY